MIERREGRRIEDKGRGEKESRKGKEGGEERMINMT